MRPIVVNNVFLVTFSGLDADQTTHCDKSWSEIKSAVESGKQLRLRYMLKQGFGYGYSDLITSTEFNRDEELERIQGGLSVTTLFGDSATVMTLVCEMTQNNIHCTQQIFNIPVGGDSDVRQENMGSK